MKDLQKVIWLSLWILLSACGGGSGGDDSNENTGGNEDRDPDEPVTKNVALEDNGGTATSNYPGSSPDHVNDDDTDSTYWAGTAQDDDVTVEFDQKYSVDEITVFTNATNNQDTKLQISKDGKNFSDIGFLQGDPYCATLKMGSGRIQCGLDSDQEATHVRVVIEADSGISNIKIYEIEAQGH